MRQIHPSHTAVILIRPVLTLVGGSVTAMRRVDARPVPAPPLACSAHSRGRSPRRSLCSTQHTRPRTATRALRTLPRAEPSSEPLQHTTHMSPHRHSCAPHTTAGGALVGASAAHNTHVPTPPLVRSAHNRGRSPRRSLCSTQHQRTYTHVFFTFTFFCCCLPTQHHQTRLYFIVLNRNFIEF